MTDTPSLDSTVRRLRDQGWTLEPPRQITPEYLEAREAPAVFTPAEGIIALSRGNGDATIDLTPAQAREVATKLDRWADHYREPKWSS